jgi:hypothetical protein
MAYIDQVAFMLNPLYDLKMALIAQAQVKWLVRIAQCVPQDYAAVEKACSEICAMSPAPTLQTLPLIFDMVAAGVTLQQIHDDYASGTVPLRTLAQIAGWWP